MTWSSLQAVKVWAKTEMYLKVQSRCEVGAVCTRPDLFVINKRKKAASTAQNEKGLLFATYSTYPVSSYPILKVEYLQTLFLSLKYQALPIEMKVALANPIA